MESLSFSFALKSLSDAGGIEGLASTYGNVDRVGDRVERGAFSRSLAESGGKVPLLWQHQQAEPIGVAFLSDGPTGLSLRGQLDLDIETGRRAYSALKKGIVGGLSIGYDIVRSTRDSDGVRRLQEIKLWEVSVVTIPANASAVVTRVKTADAEELAAFSGLIQDMQDTLAVHEFRRLLKGV